MGDHTGSYLRRRERRESENEAMNEISKGMKEDQERDGKSDDVGRKRTFHKRKIRLENVRGGVKGWDSTKEGWFRSRG